MTFAATIRAARKAKGITQAVLARRLGVKPPTITDYEQSTNVSEATLLKVASALGMTLRVEFVDKPSDSVAGFGSELERDLAASTLVGR